jgi:hypothetical protein
MNFRMSKTLKFWVDVECEQRKTQHVGKAKKALVAEVLQEWEGAGEAMRCLRARIDPARAMTHAACARSSQPGSSNALSKYGF